MLFKFTHSKKTPQEVKAGLGLGQTRRTGCTVGQADGKPRPHAATAADATEARRTSSGRAPPQREATVEALVRDYRQHTEEASPWDSEHPGHRGSEDTKQARSPCQGVWC